MLNMTLNEVMNALTSGYFPGFKDCDSYVITNPNQNNVFSGKFIGITDDIGIHNLVYINHEGVLCADNKYNFDKTYPDILSGCNIYALKIPRSEINNKLCNLIGKQLSNEELYSTVFEEKLFSYDQIGLSEKVICEVDDMVIDSMIESSVYQDSMIPTKDGQWWNPYTNKKYIRSEVYPGFFVESTENKIFMEQILLGGVV